MSDTLPLELKVCDMIGYGYTCLQRFPRTERHTLAADIKQSMFGILRLVIRAKRQYHKKTTLQDLDIENQTLMALVRLAKDLAFLPFKQYKLWAEMIVEIGRMIGGWLKSQRHSPDDRAIGVSPPVAATRTTAPSVLGLST